MWLALLLATACYSSHVCYPQGVGIFFQLEPLNWDLPDSQLFLSALRLAGKQASGGYGLAWRKARRQQVADKLREHAKKSQAPMIKDLKEAGIEYKSFWINNSLYVKGAPCHFQLLLLTKFADRVKEVVPDGIVAHIPKPPPPSSLSGPIWSQLTRIAVENEGQVPWNLEMINVKQAWKVSQGDRITVASIDTGVVASHPSLAKSYRGKDSIKDDHGYHWFDPKGKSKTPDDPCGHGTHTMGTICGESWGVAPGVTWITARGCTEQGCTQHDLLASAQWVMCPTGPTGGERCDLGADVISNSWGSSADDKEGGQQLDWFLPAVDAWVAAGMIPVFAIGNDGPGCGTAGAPGTFAKVIGVGSVGASACLSRFSSHGPGPLKKSPAYAADKPDIVAPGEGILSASHKGSGVVAMSGTSMSCPHVAGVVALMLSLKPELEVEQVKLILKSTSGTAMLKQPKDGQPVCKAVPWDDFPQSLHYGAGLVDALKALQSLQ